MNRKTAIILLSTACLFALMNQSLAAKGKPASDVQNPDQKDDEGEERKHGHGRSYFRKEIEQIFDKHGVEPTIRDKILNDITASMARIQKENGSFRKKRLQKNDKTEA